MIRSLPSECKVVQLKSPTTTSSAITTRYVSLKNALKAWIVVNLTQAVGHATPLTPRRATDVAGSGAANLAGNVLIWACEDTVLGEIAPVPAAGSYTVASDIKNKQVIFEVDPAALGEGFDCLALLIGASAQITNFASVDVYLLSRYQQATPPSALAD
jgi:hypothetical protein